MSASERIPAIDRSEVVARLRRSAERFRRAARVSAILVRLVPGTDESDALEARVRELAAGFNAGVIGHGLEFEEHSRRLESAVPALERELEAFDARIPTTAFQERFERLTESAAALADYAALLGEHLGDSLARIDRVQFLITRAIRTFTNDEWLEPSARVALLTSLIPTVRSDPATCANAIESFDQTGRRLARFTSLDELLGSGLFDELGGFKVSLREQLLEPSVMAALIELDGTISTVVGRLCEGAPEREQAFSQHLAQVDHRLEAMFTQLRARDAQLTERFAEWVSRPKKPKAPVEAPAPFTGTRRSKRPLVLAIAVAILSIVAVARHHRSNLHELQSTDLRTLSPILARGAVDPPIFIGEIDRIGWAGLDASRRREAGARLARALGERGWSSGTVLLDDHVVMQIAEGQVLLVQ